MSIALQLRRGTTTQHSTFTGLQAEATVDTTKKTLVIHDGTTPGGIPLAKESALNGVLRYDSSQATTDPNKAQARANAGAARAPTGAGIVVQTGADATACRFLTAGAGIYVGNADGIGGNPSITNTGVTSVNGQTGAVSVSGYSLAQLKTEDGHGSGLDADTLDSYHAGNFALSGHVHGNYVTTDNGANSIGSYCFAAPTADNIVTATDAVLAGSSLRPAGMKMDDTYSQESHISMNGAFALSGTWKCCGYSPYTGGGGGRHATLWQRIV